MTANVDLKLAASHAILGCECRGDTLIVAPHGDLPEFRTTEFQDELQRIQRIAGGESVVNIICDLSEKSYFGQEMMVPLLGLRDQINDGGRFVLAGLSTEMATLFEHSASGTHIMQYPDRHAAVRDVATVSLSDSAKAGLKRWPMIASTLLALVLVGGLYGAWRLGLEEVVAGGPSEQLYNRLVESWEDTEKVVTSNPSKGNWKGLGSRIQDRIFDPILRVKALENRTDADNAVLVAATTLQGMSADPKTQIESRQDSFVDKMTAARELLESTHETELRSVQLIALPAGP